VKIKLKRESDGVAVDASIDTRCILEIVLQKDTLEICLFGLKCLLFLPVPRDRHAKPRNQALQNLNQNHTGPRGRPVATTSTH
jgi:hypothetical protein